MRLVGEIWIVISFTVFLAVQPYIEMLAAMLGLGAIFLRMCSLFLRAISSLTNSLLRSIILLIFYICFFLVYSLCTFLFQSSFVRFMVLFNELLGVDFFTGDSVKEDIPFSSIVLGIAFQFVTITCFFFSRSFFRDQYREFNSKSVRYFSSLRKKWWRSSYLSLFFLSKTARAKMKPLLYLSTRLYKRVLRSFSWKTLEALRRVLACTIICPKAARSSSEVISVRFLFEQQRLSFTSAIQSLILMSSSVVKMMFPGTTPPCTIPFPCKNCRHSSSGRKVLLISVSSKGIMLWALRRLSSSVSRVEAPRGQRSPLLQKMGLMREG